MVMALPVLIVGLGMDDTFIIVTAYNQIEQDLSVDAKIVSTLERAGASIFVTSMTDLCAFLLGMNTKIPALETFSIYAALAVFFDFVYQVYCRCMRWTAKQSIIHGVGDVLRGVLGA